MILSKRAELKPVALMRLTEVKDPDELLKKYDRDDIVIESKLDGWKLQVIETNGKIHIYSRRGEEVTENFPQIVKALYLPSNTLAEGEIVYWEGKKQDIGKVTSIAGSSPENAAKKMKPLVGKKVASLSIRAQHEDEFDPERTPIKEHDYFRIHRPLDEEDVFEDVEWNPEEIEKVLKELDAHLRPTLSKRAKRRGVEQEFVWLYAHDHLYTEKNVENEKELMGSGHSNLANEAGISSKQEYPRGFVTFYDDGKITISTYGLSFWDMPTRVQNAVERRFGIGPTDYTIEDVLQLPPGTVLYASDPLAKYKSKRKFEETPEPEGSAEKGENKHRFVIQRHLAERAGEHFDLRLENDEGAMSSWALPKHKLPSGKERLLAIETENHPISYNKFQGTIPEGEYGAGKVEIYDSGVYEPIEWTNSTIKFKLNGKKENGTYTLHKTDGKKWIIMVHKEKK